LRSLRISNDVVAAAMIGKSNTAKVCALVGKLWKLPLCGNRGKTKKQFFHRSHIAWKTLRKKHASSFPQFPQLRRLSFFLGKETRENRRNPSRSNCNWVEGGILRWSGIQAGRLENVNRGRSRESFSLTSPFIERRAVSAPTLNYPNRLLPNRFHGRGINTGVGQFL